MIHLVSSDGQEFAVQPKAASLMKVLQIDEDAAMPNQDITLPQTDGAILAKVTEWCEHHQDDDPNVEQLDYSRDMRTDDVPEWDMELLGTDQKTLFGVLQASNCLDIRGLQVNVCKTIANIIKSKTAQQVRDHFHIIKDLADEEEEKIRRENSWCDDE